jgi:hypothetical protein
LKYKEKKKMRLIQMKAVKEEETAMVKVNIVMDMVRRKMRIRRKKWKKNIFFTI